MFFLVLLGYIAFGVFVFRVAAQPPLSYVEVDTSTLPPSPLCPGQAYVFNMSVTAKKSPTVVAVTENWTSVDDPKKTILDSSPQWRIINHPGDGAFTILSEVPLDIQPGEYRYIRAFGLTQPIIIENLATIDSVEACNARTPAP